MATSSKANSSILNPAAVRQVVEFQDCNYQTCTPLSALVARWGAWVGNRAFPKQNSVAAVPIDCFTPYDLTQTLVVGIGDDRVTKNSFNAFRITAHQAWMMFGIYGLTDSDDVLINEVDATVTTQAAAWTNTGAVINSDSEITFSGFDAPYRPMAIVTRIKVPDAVYRLEIQPSGTASPYPELIKISFSPDDCREVVLVSWNCPRERFAGLVSTPTNQNTLHYVVPIGKDDIQVAGAGGEVYLQVRTFNSAGAQTAYDLAVTTWEMPWSNAVLNALSAHKGVASAGATAIWSQTSLLAGITNLQNFV